MKPAGAERDRDIAEVRGDEVFIECHHDLIPCDCIWEPTKTECLMDSPETCRDRQIYPPLPYSTDISCAMELWEEMHNSWQTSTWVIDTKCWEETGHCWAKVRQWWKEIEHESQRKHKSLSEAMADAISGAWLKWKKEVSQ
jgi:hypothetical protein